MSEKTYQALWAFARQVAVAVEAIVPCERIGVAVIGLEVPHTHVHLVPINGIGDLDFSRPAFPMSQEDMKELAEQITAAFE